MVKRWTMMVGALAVCACSDGAIQWQKPGTSDADMHAMVTTCTKQARADSREVLDDQINDISAPGIENLSVPSDGTMRNIDRQALADEEKEIRRDSFNRCMALAGYRPLPQRN
jgi:hypothetical protein